MKLVALSFVGTAVALCHPSPAQCTNPWVPMQGLPGPNNSVYASAMWDPDGIGPLPPRLVIAGTFLLPGTRIAAWDAATAMWSPLGTGLGDTVNSLAVLPNGELVAAGLFLNAGTTPCSRVARWNGASWSPLGSGTNGPVNDLDVLPNGDLVAVGSFTSAGGVAANRIARWNGSTWAPFGAGCDLDATCVAVLQNGDVVAGGSFTSAGGIAANQIARWDGATWSALGTGIQGTPYGLHVRPNGDLVAGGNFTSAGGVPANYIALWNGAAWSALGSGLNLSSTCMASLPNGDLLVGGAFTQAGGGQARGIARWNGTAWSSLGSGLGLNGRAATITVMPNGVAAVGGYFFDPGITGGANLAQWDGASWSAVPHSAAFTTDGYVRASVTMPNGDLVIGGQFQLVGNTQARTIARWNGTTWSALGSGLGSYGDWVNALAVLPNGDLVAGGRFTHAGTTVVNYIARWNGAAWSSLGGGMNQDGIVNALGVLPNGDLVAAGSFYYAGGVYCSCIARWNGSVWAPIGGGLTGAPPPYSPNAAALAVAANGELVVAGGFYYAGGVLAQNWARWDGSQWSAMGAGPQTPTCMLLLPNGDVLAGGWDAGATLQRWNGTTWSNLGAGMNGPVFALHALVDGDVLVGGRFTTAGGASANRIARWNGSAFAAIGSGVGSANYDYVAMLAQRPNGDVVIGGSFGSANGAYAANLARVTTTCPATAAAVGAGCTGSGGANVLAARSLPWLGTTFRSHVDGAAGTTLAVEVVGFSPLGLSLGFVLPQAAPGCTLFASPDVLRAHVTNGGMLDLAMLLPNSPALAGGNFRQQVVPLEFDAQGTLVGASATNALQVVLGDF
ncbi:MAG: hypothetical protein JNK15_05730 [Planctomycetes bacterium]|nr:hypothetical protein [Planctomycetota bacterium]